MRYLPSLLRVQILSNDGICLGANINKFDQMWYLLHICIDFAVVVNPFFRAVLWTLEGHLIPKIHRIACLISQGWRVRPEFFTAFLVSDQRKTHSIYANLQKPYNFPIEPPLRLVISIAFARLSLFLIPLPFCFVSTLPHLPENRSFRSSIPASRCMFTWKCGLWFTFCGLLCQAMEASVPMTNLKTVNVPYLGKDPVLQDT